MNKHQNEIRAEFFLNWKMFAKWRHVQTFILQVDVHLHISTGGDETEFCVSLEGCTGKKCTVEADAIKFR